MFNLAVFLFMCFVGLFTSYNWSQTNIFLFGVLAGVNLMMAVDIALNAFEKRR